jgi:hypothetical protein
MQQPQPTGNFPCPGVIAVIDGQIYTIERSIGPNRFIRIVPGSSGSEQVYATHYANGWVIFDGGIHYIADNQLICFDLRSNIRNEISIPIDTGYALRMISDEALMISTQDTRLAYMGDGHLICYADKHEVMARKTTIPIKEDYELTLDQTEYEDCFTLKTPLKKIELKEMRVIPRRIWLAGGMMFTLEDRGYDNISLWCYELETSPIFVHRLQFLDVYDRVKIEQGQIFVISGKQLKCHDLRFKLKYTLAFEKEVKDVFLHQDQIFVTFPNHVEIYKTA